MFHLYPCERWLLVGFICAVYGIQEWIIQRKQEKIREEEWKSIVKRTRKEWELQRITNQVLERVCVPVKEEPKQE